MPSESPSSSLSFWRLSALRLRASALSASVAFAICVDVIALQSPLNRIRPYTLLLGCAQDVLPKGISLESTGCSALLMQDALHMRVIPSTPCDKQQAAYKHPHADALGSSTNRVYQEEARVAHTCAGAPHKVLVT